MFGPGGDLYVASKDSDQVLRYRGDGSFVGVVMSNSHGLDGPWALAFGPDGNLYVGAHNSHNILTYDPANGGVATFVTAGSGGLDVCLGLVFGPDGNLYASSRGVAAAPYGPDEVLRFEGPGGASPGSPLPAVGQAGAVFIPDANPSGFDNPNALSFGPDGRLYVAFGFDSIVNRYDANTGALVDAFVPSGSGGLDGTSAIAFRPDGFLYVASVWNNQVLRYDANSGAFAGAIVPGGSGGLSNPGGLAFDAVGNLYVTSGNTSQILRYGATSQVAFTVSLSTSSDTAVTVDYGTATSGSDFVSANGTLTFAPGETTRTILVQTVNDAIGEPTETFSVNLSNPIGATIADGQGVGTILDDDATKFYVVNDASTDRTYEYGAPGNSVENYALNAGNTAPRGAASTAAGDRVWVVDANRNVYVYNTSGSLLGSWAAGGLASNATVEGIATNGTDVWIVDARQDKVFRYTGAASRLSGSQNAASSFALNSGNTSPKDVVTDGTSLWVVNDSSTDKVFKYTLSGSLSGSWTVSGAGSSPTGITLDPSGGGTLWLVDSGTDRVYQFDNARSRTSGSQSPATSFALAAGNTNPQGIADPPAGSVASVPHPASPRPSLGSGFTASRGPDRNVAVGTWNDQDLTSLALDSLVSRTRRGRTSRTR